MAISRSTRRRIGKTALDLPVFGFGAAHIGELYGTVDEADARATLDAAWKAGVRYYDTAPWYGRGLSEHRLGGFLRTKPRAEFQITTKVGRTLHRPKDPKTFDRAPWTGGLNFEVRFDYSYDGIMRSYEQALQRLALDTVDALVIHDLDAAYHGEHFSARQKDLRESGIRALVELKASGDIAAYGMGINTSEAFDTVATQVELDFCLVAMPYTLLDQSSLETGMARCLEKGMSVIIGAPFASGILVTGSGGSAKYGYANASPQVQQKVRGLEAACAEHNVALPAAALQFVLAHPAVASVIPGAARPAEVEQNLAHLETAIPSGFWADLKTRGLIDPAAPVPAER
ncbi:D-threo-aldose 1-dehydrogenase [Devosia enhydra]|uniref:D-threo-aldose 1-dehydrogenase n=1 Tax=Devosia enhydra TaxID=665118 RepID=A0A1K2I356_9HYPH|nr:aldo/keto reductase [Devosia enhydra]SFZ86777.1 D-threo-aldose 1-dehydrogenase [Devosia enhydra]